jgi:hypothetical protein
MLARLVAVVAGVVGALVLAVRLLFTEPAQNPRLLILSAMVIAAVVHLLAHESPVEDSRAARLAVVVAAAAWAMGGHPGAAPALAAAAVLLAMAVAPRWPKPA